ncbi:putative ABC transport system permease protein [Salinimicrobium catena]|uniref:Putative ABC transport system permease protein n=1 Tax=Salinimicrobium catena TaxID=390640 RepID=A0A1H5NGR2_9FLAO|nr:FtsX-like permease family protein [Salinimicrobium catena]SDL44525.1 putative ABC transport system permease protein [Salinimicrobium catena]SEF00071.1 putative ABC transport system permease protein [Salinimicrobium catena]
MKEQRKFGSFRSSFSWLLKMAGRDGKASSRKLTLFMASIVLGIAAVVGIQSFGENLKDNIASQSKSLMGADFTIDSEDPPNERVQQIIDSLGGADAREIRFASMAAFSRTDATKLVQVRGIEGDFPFYGELETKPSSAANDFRTRDAALVDATAMAQLGVEIGDSIKIGAVKLPVAGELISVPGSSSLFSSMAPPVIIPYKYIDESGLVQKGSRIDYEFYFRSSLGTDMEELEEKLDPVLDQNDADLDTHSSTSERLGRRYENFSKFLNLVAFIALLLGCVGIASAIHIYIKGKLKAVALLKCLGATRKQTFLIYLIQIAVMGFLGGLMGTLLGLLLQRSFPVVLGDLLPFQVELSFSWQPVFMGLLLGVIISVLFALYPLMGTLYVSPLETLRVREKGTGRSKRSAIWVSLAIFLFIYLFSFWLLNDWLYAAGFVGGMMLTFAILAGVASLFMNLIRKYFPASWGFVPRQSLRNLFRPQNQTLTLVLTIGVGAFLISTLYFTRDLLLAQASIEGDADSPNLILLDVQTEQRDKVVATIRQQGFPVINTIPIVTMRVQNLRGIPVNELRKDTASEVNTWILNHEFRVTYRDSIIASETLQEGQWVPEYKEQEIIPISVSDGFAQSAMVGVGDTVDFNVQGVVMPTVVKSIRKVDWARMQLNFSLVFPAGVLENAPQFKVLTTRVPDERSSAHLQRELVRQFPNVSIIDLRQVLTVIGDILDKISLLINFMAFFSIFTGVIVLLGAVRTSKYQRIRESVLLRTIGARSRQILKITALEYLYLGALGSLSGILLSLIASQLLAWLLFDASFLPSIIPFLIIFPAITLLVLAVGLGNSLGIIKSPPLEVLRKESR